MDSNPVDLRKLLWGRTTTCRRFGLEGSAIVIADNLHMLANALAGVPVHTAIGLSRRQAVDLKLTLSASG